MTAFKKFDPWAEGAAKPAKAAKPEDLPSFQAAKAHLKLAKDSDTLGSLSQTLAVENPGHTYTLAGLGTLAGTQGQKHAVALECPDGVPGEWVHGVAKILSMTAPGDFTSEAWAKVREDSYTLMKDWAATAHGLGWSAYDLWGCNKSKPYARVDQAGLALVLAGGSVLTMTEGTATIRRSTGATLTYRRNANWPQPGQTLLFNLERVRR